MGYRADTHRGFTYVELLVTLAILSVLSLVALPFAELSVKRSKEYDLRRAVRDIRQAIDAYKQAADAGLIAPGTTVSNYPATLDVLVTGVPNAKVSGTYIYFLRRVPTDPFAPNPALPPDQSWGVRSYASPPDQPQKGDDVFDIYSQSTGIGLNGIPYRNW
jgi:general secretion pathway protein G